MKLSARLDSIVDKATAFRTWAEFTEATAAGYVPTLDTRNLDAETAVRIEVLQEACRAHGVRYWEGRGS